MSVSAVFYKRETSTISKHGEKKKLNVDVQSFPMCKNVMWKSLRQRLAPGLLTKIDNFLYSSSKETLGQHT